MKEFKGTQGEWLFDESLYVDTEREAVVETSQGSWTIAKVQDGSRNNNSEVIRANAQLIAAAPELLNASIQALRFIQKTGINYDNAEIYNEINKAINKALGK